MPGLPPLAAPLQERTLEVQLERHPAFLLMRVKGDLRLWNNATAEEGLLRGFKSSLCDSPKQLVLSLRAVKYLDTRGICALVQLLVECARQRAEIKVVMPPGMPGQALKYVRIFEHWARFEDEATAFQAAEA